MSEGHHPLILVLDQAGNPQRWCNYEEAAYYYAKDLIAWTPTEQGFTVYGGTNASSGRTSSLDMNTIIAVKGSINERSLLKVPTLTNKTLFRRDQHLCAYCGQTYGYDDLSRDHVIPVSRNGPNRWTNCVTACRPCNKHKDDRTPEEAGMKLLFVPYAPSRAEYLILLNRSILADQMSFLLAKVGKDSRLKVKQ